MHDPTLGALVPGTYMYTAGSRNEWEDVKTVGTQTQKDSCKKTSCVFRTGIEKYIRDITMKPSGPANEKAMEDFARHGSI